MEQDGIAPALRHLAGLGIQSVVIEGGAAVHAAAWDEALVDCVQLYVAPLSLGAAGVPLLDGRSFSPAALLEAHVEQLGPDVLIEGYVHRPH
jgi:riboflavin biosynthesis pyrimidine reductase